MIPVKFLANLWQPTMKIFVRSVLIQSQSVTDGQTDRSLTIAKTCALHAVEHKKSCAVLNFAHFDSLVCFVACSREKSRSLSLVPFFHSLSLSLTGLA